MYRTIDSSRQSAAKGVLLALALGLSLAAGAAVSPALAAKPAASTAPAGASLSGVVNVNTATPDQLQLLPGVGQARAGAIVEFRKQQGGFKQVEDLLAVKGIGESMLERLRPFVTVTGKTTARKL
jgi:competence protein ComEA